MKKDVTISQERHEFLLKCEEKIKQVGELVNQLTAFAMSLNSSVGVKKTPAPAKKPSLNRAERRERNLSMIRGKKKL